KQIEYFALGEKSKQPTAQDWQGVSSRLASSRKGLRVGLVRPAGRTKVNNARPFRTVSRSPVLPDAGASGGRFLGRTCFPCFYPVPYLTVFYVLSRFRHKDRPFDWVFVPLIRRGACYFDAPK